MELENTLLRTELSLHQREESIRELERINQRLQRDILQSKMTSSRAIKQFERRTNDANKKLAQMNSELARAQEHARRFQGLLTVERRKQKGLKVAEKCSGTSLLLAPLRPNKVSLFNKVSPISGVIVSIFNFLCSWDNWQCPDRSGVPILIKRNVPQYFSNA